MYIVFYFMIMFCDYMCIMSLWGMVVVNGYLECSVVALLSYPAFLKDCGRGESLQTATCLKTAVGCKRVHVPVKYSCSNKTSFCVFYILRGS